MILKKIIRDLMSLFTKISPFISFRYIYIGKGVFANLFTFSKAKLTPNLIIIGAQKSGTTSLYRYLDAHRDIFMSKHLKEPGYFIYSKSLVEYMNKRNIYFKTKNQLLKNHILQGYSGQKFIGDASTYYTIGSQSWEYDIPQKIKKNNSNSKLIYIIRNPLDRIRSAYCHGLKKGTVGNDFNQFINNNKNVILTSLYYKQIMHYLEYFPKKQLKIIIFEKFIENPTNVLDEINSFLNLKKYVKYPDYKIYNKSPNIYKNYTASLKFSEENYNKIIKPIKYDIKKMEDLIGYPLDIWNISEASWVKN